MYIHELKHWPNFTWEYQQVAAALASVRYRQGKVLGQMSGIGFKLKEETILQTLTQDVLRSSEIEGEILNAEQVRSSIAQRLGIDIGGLTPANRHVEGIVEMMLDATQHYDKALTDERLYGWHNAMFPTGLSGLYKITVANWRTGPMQVISGAMGKERVHFKAPHADNLPAQMQTFLHWFNTDNAVDPVLKAAIAHLWFVTVHPFDDGNGRIARAITDMLLARADETAQRFYSMSAQILLERNQYYNILESTQKGDLDITEWLQWFLNCLNRCMDSTQLVLNKTITRNQFWEINKNTNFNARQLKVLTLLLDDFFGSLNVSKWAKIAHCSTDTALRDVQDLVKKAVLVKKEGGGRNTSYTLAHV